MTFRDYLSAFKSFRGLLAGIGTLVPGIGYLVALDPPSPLAVGSIASALSLATVLLVYYFKPRGARRRFTAPTRAALRCFVVSLGTLVLYLLLLDTTTLVDPQNHDRFQIGFGRTDWTLTAVGKGWKQTHPDQAPLDWMMSCGFEAGRGERIWKPWTITTAGCLLLVSFVGMTVAWTGGWAVLARQFAASGKRDGPSGTAEDTKRET